MNNKLVRGKPFQTGESGNPHGRPKGSRNAFSVAFIGDLTATWREHGASVLQRVARSDPTRFLGIAASIVPKDVALTIEQQSPSGLDPADWSLITEVLGAIKQAIPDAADRRPGEVLQLTLDALRAHSAKVVDSQDGD
jgi:hypothetical protein